MSCPGPVDLLVLWEWPFDADFIALLRERCTGAGLVLGDIAADHLPAVEELRLAGRLPAVILDRASDAVPQLVPALEQLKQDHVLLVNDAAQMTWARDKATLHLELVAAGISVPYAVIVSTEDRTAVDTLPDSDHDGLGSPFVIKPAEGGGGEGVVLDARSTTDVAQYLDATGYDKVLLQHLVEPRTFAGRRGWFRVFHIHGTIVPCWWDEQTHEYRQLDAAEEATEALGPLREITSALARISRIELFTTEIACDQEGRFVVVDFVNEMPDLRPQSRHKDGVPDCILEVIAGRLVALTVAARLAPGEPAQA